MVANTVRQNVVAHLYTLLREMTDEGGRVWNNVLKENLDELKAEQLPAVGIEEGDEECDDQMYPVIARKLTVFIEFRFRGGRTLGVDVYDKFNYYLGLLQKALLTDRQVGGYAYDIQEAGNSPRIIDKDDPLPGGVLMLYVYYRSKNADPYTQL